jgi:hypothetical protein
VRRYPGSARCIERIANFTVYLKQEGEANGWRRSKSECKNAAKLLGFATFLAGSTDLRGVVMFAQIHWGRAAVGGLLAELTVFVIVFPTRYLFGQRAFLASILIASTVMPFLFAMWVGRRVESRFVLHGALVGLVAALVYMGLAWGQPQPLLYKIAHGLKVVGGVAGGVAASRRKLSEKIVAQS